MDIRHDSSSPVVGHRDRRTRRSAATTVAVVVAAVAGLGPVSPSGTVAASTQPLTTIDGVVSEGAEMAVHLVADDWTPAPAGTVNWTVTVRNRAEAAAAAQNPELWVSSGDGAGSIVVDESTMPEGWQMGWSVDDGASLWSADPLAPGASVSFTVAMTVTAPSGSVAWMHASTRANNQWNDTPRPGRWANTHVVVNGSRLSGSVVSDADGSPLGNVCVDANDQSGWWNTMTRPDGSWDLAVPAGAEIDLRFDPTCQVDGQATSSVGIATAHATRWWPGTGDPSESQRLAVGSGRALGEVRLQPGGAVTGNVTVPGGFEPSNVWVSVETIGSGWWLAGASVRSDGTYFLHGLPAGSHIVRFEPSDQQLGRQFFDGAASRNVATPVNVAGGQVSTAIDADIVIASAIAGTVTDADSGAGIDGVAVTALTSAREWVGSATTRADGSYTIGGLTAGTYLVYFEDPSGSYVAVFHDGTWAESDATLLELAVAESATIDVAMAPGVSVSGRVTAGADGHGLAAGDPIPEVVVLGWVGQFDFESDPVAFAMTDADGRYTLAGLPPTGVSIAYVHGLEMEDDGGGIDARWAVQFWPGVSGPFAAGVLDLASSPDGESDVDIVLEPAPIITGRVLDAHGGTLAAATGLEGMAVALFVAGDTEPFGLTFTDATGAYELSVPFADFDVYLGTVDVADAYDGAYGPIWFGGAAMDVTDFDELDPAGDGAVPIAVPAGVVTNGVHLVHDPPPPPGPPQVPAALDAAPGDGSIVVSWEPIGGPVDDYLVQLDGVVVATIPAGGVALQSTSSTLQYVIEGLVNGQSYDVSVLARNLGGTAVVNSTTAVPTSSGDESSGGDGADDGPSHAPPGNPSPGIGHGPSSPPASPHDTPDGSDGTGTDVPAGEPTGPATPTTLPAGQTPDVPTDTESDGPPPPETWLLPATGRSSSGSVAIALMLVMFGLALATVAAVGTFGGRDRRQPT